MRAVVQRVAWAEVRTGDEILGSIGKGLLVFVGVGEEVGEEDVRYLANKVLHLRIFEDPAGKMNLSVLDVRGDVLVVSQFTLYGDCRKGNRPSFASAAPPEMARHLYGLFVEQLSTLRACFG